MGGWGWGREGGSEGGGGLLTLLDASLLGSSVHNRKDGLVVVRVRRHGRGGREHGRSSGNSMTWVRRGRQSGEVRKATGAHLLHFPKSLRGQLSQRADPGVQRTFRMQLVQFRFSGGALEGKGALQACNT